MTNIRKRVNKYWGASGRTEYGLSDGLLADGRAWAMKDEIINKTRIGLKTDISNKLYKINRKGAGSDKP